MWLMMHAFLTERFHQIWVLSTRRLNSRSRRTLLFLRGGLLDGGLIAEIKLNPFVQMGYEDEIAPPNAPSIPLCNYEFVGKHTLTLTENFLNMILSDALPACLKKITNISKLQTWWKTIVKVWTMNKWPRREDGTVDVLGLSKRLFDRNIGKWH